MAKCISVKHQVEFYETDMAGIVHFSNYFRWMESVETAFLKDLAIPLLEKNKNVITGWPKINTTCNFTAPLRFQDIVEIELTLREIRNSTLHYYFQFFKLENNTRIKIATGEMSTACAKFDVLQETMAACLIEEKVRVRLEKQLLDK